MQWETRIDALLLPRQGSLCIMRKGGRRDALAIHPNVAQRIRAYAYAGCGLYRPASFDPSSQRQIASWHLLSAALIIDDDDAARHERGMVGTWKEHWISEGNEGIPDGTEIDAAYAQWHSDGTEINVSGLRAP